MILFGIPVAIHWTTILLAVIIFFDAFLYIQKAQKNSVNGIWIAAGIISVVVILSVVSHELSHAIVAGWFGIPIVGARVVFYGI